MNNKTKTILFVMPRLPFPVTSGRKTSLYHYCRILSSELHFRLIVAAFLEKDDDPKLKPDFIDRLVILPKDSVGKRISYILKDSIVLSKKPMQVSLYWSEKAKNLVDKLVAEENPDIVIGDMIRSTEYIRDLKVFRIADLDDRISLRYERQLENDIANINPYGAFLSTVPKFVQRVMLFRLFKLFIVKKEIALLKKYELEISSACDRTIFVAQKEADTLNAELGENKATAVPLGVDVDYFSYRESGKAGNLIGFLGAMSVAHNENAVRHFASDILPLILKEVPDAKFLIIGGGVTDELQQIANDHVSFTGHVADVRDYLEQCKVFVCPMTFGSGIKTKNLEAMSLGLPIVTTSIGAENINAEDGKDWLIADDNKKFAQNVAILLNDNNERKKIGRSGCQYINEEWTWNAARLAFEALLGRI